jgi:phosphoribosylaminoimidazole-succinocarboxamide synthase
MDTISQLRQDIERYDADALYYMGRAEHCQYEAALLRRELAQEQLREGLDEAHALAATIVELAGLTGAERETAERVMCSQSCSVADVARLRSIALNHSIFTTEIV